LFVYLWQWKRRAALEPPASVSLPELDSSNARFIDEDSVKLAGIVNALMERALRLGFSLPLPAGDLFLQRYRTLENSEHPIWTDKAINQIRRDFLHHAGMVGSSEKFGMNLLEWQDERQQATLFGRQLIEKLTGVKNPNDEIFVSLTWPDKKWDRRDTYTLGDAAYLWFDLEPPQDGQQMPEDVRSLYQKWRKQIYDDKMDLPVSDTVEQAMNIALEKTNIEDQRTVTPDTKVRIAELEKVAEKEGVKPIFLFPHRRGE
jgi:hypothetical protein